MVVVPPLIAGASRTDGERPVVVFAVAPLGTVTVVPSENVIVPVPLGGTALAPPVAVAPVTLGEMGFVPPVVAVAPVPLGEIGLVPPVFAIAPVPLDEIGLAPPVVCCGIGVGGF